MPKATTLARLGRTTFCALLLAAMGHFAPVNATETVKLTIVAGHPPVFLWVKHFKETLVPTVDAELAKTGKYKIEWTQAYGGTVAKVGEELEAIEQGLADLGGSWSLFDAAKLPLQNVSYFTPFVTSNGELVAEVTEELQREYPEMGKLWERYNQIYLGGGVSIDGYNLWSKFPVTKVADLAGRKIGAPGPAANWLKGTGAVGVAGNLTEYYNDLKTGVYDGVVVFFTAAAPARLHEVAPHVTIVDFGSPYGGGITFNMNRWKSLPEEVRAAVKTAVGAFRTAYYVELRARTAGAMDAVVKGGGKISELPAAERAKWANAIPNVALPWAKGLDQQGLPGTEVLKAYMAKMKSRGLKPLRDWTSE